MTLHANAATRTAGRGSITVTRSATDGLNGALATFLFDDTAVLNKLVLAELFADIRHRLSKDFVGVSLPAHLESLAGAAFDDGSAFEDGALFSDQLVSLTYVATIDASNAHVIARDTSDSIGAGAAALILEGSKAKPELWKAVKAIGRALQRDGVSFTSPADYPTTGSSVE
jgi:hypothetical protein